MCSLVDYPHLFVIFFVYLIFLFIDFKVLPLFICNEIHYFKLETCKGTNKIFYLIDAMQRKWQLKWILRHTVDDNSSKQENNGNEQTECLLHFLASSSLFLDLTLLQRQ